MQCSIQRSFLSKSLATSAARSYATGSYQLKAKKTTLDNGVTIVSPEQQEDAPLASVGVFVATGSAYETHENHGCSHYLRRFLYKGTNRTSGLRHTRTVENLMATLTAENNPEYLAYKASFPQQSLGDALAIMGDVLRPRLAEWEFRDVRSLVQHDVNERNADLEGRVEDSILHTAFGGVGMGRSVLCPQYNVNQLYPDHVAEYILGHVVGRNITIVANVADHEKLVEEAANGFGELPKDPVVEVVKPDDSVYYGGSRLESNGPTNVYAQAYEGANASEKNAVAQAIFAEILGASGSLSEPSNSRIGKSLAFSGVDASVFIAGGEKNVFGIRAVSTTETTSSLSETVNNLLSNPDSISEEEFNRAKLIVQSKTERGFDCRNSFLESLHGATKIVSEDSDVTLADVQSFASGLTEKRPTIFASGNLAGLPSFAI